ncbi:hypothetical protein [Acinetobacter radioresistens]|uniref:Uncharacterized protein n=1 Tax=Acinetobacter radioresistens TaxID=40216 RepID=A0A8H2K380_ACIRA|nr:hypothetical protein [Acinetobacter radioresistens]TNX93661.1 hypothetical protein FHY67_04280 [Acinetobacter radioresistens]
MESAVIYEVGTFEKYEEGFHAFFRCLSKDRAVAVLNVAREIVTKVPEFVLNQTDEEYIKVVRLCEGLSKEFEQRTGKKFDITMYGGDLYTIEMREVQLDR